MPKHKSFRLQVAPPIGRAAKFLLKTHLLTVWLTLGLVGFVVGLQARPVSGVVPYEEMFENLGVRSFRDAPTDTVAHFVVELGARGRVFRLYDVDAREFLAPSSVHEYRLSIGGTRYPALHVRGHIDHGFWLEIPDEARQTFMPDQFRELYRTTLDYVKPVSIVTNVLSILSGYSVGYDLATWHRSLSDPTEQERLVSTPGIGRIVAREAWKRVLLEPAVTAQDNDAAHFASTSEVRRVYTNFFKLAVSDTNGFVSREAARLESLGCADEARAMLAFARAASRAAQDTCVLTSVDFAAIEDWASLLDRHGHWAYRSTPSAGPERMEYLGTLAWYGIQPDAEDASRIWVGPRLIVRTVDADGFVADEIASIPQGCPLGWRAWLHGDAAHPSGNAWTAQWLAESRQVAPLVDFGVEVAHWMGGRSDAAETADALAARRSEPVASPAEARSEAAPSASKPGDTTPVAHQSVAVAESAGVQRPALVDSVAAALAKPSPGIREIGAGLGPPGP